MATDTHILMIPSPGGPVPTPTPMPFNGILSQALSTSVLVENMAAATDGSIAMNTPPHIPAGGPFQAPPNNQGKIMKPTGSVLIEDKPAARATDMAETCNDPAPAPIGTVMAQGTVLVGD